MKSLNHKYLVFWFHQQPLLNVEDGEYKQPQISKPDGLPRLKMLSKHKQLSACHTMS